MSIEDFQLIFYICASVGALATAGSFIYLIRKDIKSRKRISDLERVAETLEKDLVLRYQPHLWINGVELRSPDQAINFDLNNKREWCKLTEVNVILGDLMVNESGIHLPYELEPKFDPSMISDTHRRYLFFLNNSSKSLEDCEYKFEIIYHDRLDIRYRVFVEGKGAKFKMSNPAKI